MRTGSVSAILLASIFAPPSMLGQVPSSQLDAIFASLKRNAPGAAVLVMQNGKPVFRGGYGVAELRLGHRSDGEGKFPLLGTENHGVGYSRGDAAPATRLLLSIDEKTDFRLASLTKQFTATAIMLLVHDGKLHYEDHLTDIFPEFPAYGRAITVRNLLNHTSGLQDYEDPWMEQHHGAPEEKVPQIHDAEVLKILEQQKTLKFPPGTQWEYSNSGYVVLAMIVEKVSGEPFGKFLRERIFAPLGMTGTLAFEKGKNEVLHRAYGYSKTAKGWQQTDQSPTSATLGDGGVYTSINDLEKWDRALSEHTLLSVAEMEPALTPVSANHADGRPASYGFGWFLSPYNGHKRLSHDGETVGFRNSIQRFPDDKLTVIVLSNRADLNAEALALKVADLYLGSSGPLKKEPGQ